MRTPVLEDGEGIGSLIPLDEERGRYQTAKAKQAVALVKAEADQT